MITLSFCVFWFRLRKSYLVIITKGYNKQKTVPVLVRLVTNERMATLVYKSSVLDTKKYLQYLDIKSSVTKEIKHQRIFKNSQFFTYIVLYLREHFLYIKLSLLHFEEILLLFAES